MTDAVPDILARIVETKRAELEQAAVPLGEWELRAKEQVPYRRDFCSALKARVPAIIAEIKKASPSKGAIAPELSPALVAREYEQGGAAALSVLTDEKFFQGSLEDLAQARQATHLPVLRKDFILEEIQIAEAAAFGADAVLLIAAALSPERLRRLRRYAEQFRMAALVEVHDESELEAALASGATLVGVNNRDLRTFEVSLDTSLRLAPRMPADVLKVSESGIESAQDIRRLRDAGFDAFLIGERLVRSPNRSAALKALLS
ncbi:MAG: indole-3-glycerol phosphate synthase TrpC [Bryobacteraceae bacterium]|nr:indole-3-glycerol phosphate synthase TrpC [Bryobacteraceae bacterium]